MVASMLLAVEQGITDPVARKVLNDPMVFIQQNSVLALTVQINGVFAGTSLELDGTLCDGGH